MATASLYEGSTFCDVTECPICIESLPVLKRLPCAHAFCLTCLLKYSDRQRAEGDRMFCPLCRRSFSIPTGGFETMPDHFVSIVSKLSSSSSEAYGFNARIADDEDASKFRINPSRERLIEIDNPSRSSAVDLRFENDNNSAELGRLNVERNRLLSHVSVSIQRTTEHGEEVKRLIDHQCRQLVNQLIEFREEGLSDIAAREERIRRSASDASTPSSLGGSRRGARCDAASSFGNNETTIGVVEMDQILINHRCNTPLGVNYVLNESQQVVQNADGRTVRLAQNVGPADTHNRPSPPSSSQTEQRSQQLTVAKWMQRLEPGGEVRGVAQLGNRIYVVCDHTDTVRVYEVGTFKRLNGLCANKRRSMHPHDLAACDVSNCVYVSDRHSRCVWRLSPDGQRSYKWLKLTRSSGTLSLTADGRLLTLRYDPPRFDMFGEEASTLEIYGPNANLLNAVPLPRDMKDLQHVVEAPSGNFIISHGESGSLHRVIEVTAEGRVVRSFGGHKGRRLGQLDCPKHMAIDSKGNVYIADYHNDRILILDAMFGRCSYIQGSDVENACRPLRLSCDKASGLLLCGFKSGHTDVYKLIPPK